MFTGFLKFVGKNELRKMALLVLVILGKILTLVVGWYYFKYLPTPYKLIFYLTAVALCSEGYGFYIANILREPNGWLFNSYILLEVWLSGIAAIKLMNLKTKNIFFILLGIQTLFWTISVLRGSIYVFANFALVLGLIMLTLMYLIVLFSNSVFNSNDILKQPVFWLSISTVLYCACDIPYFGLHSYLISNSPRLAHRLIYINTVLDVIRYPLVAISFILLGRQKQAVLKAA